jgi:hypothetical protein
MKMSLQSSLQFSRGRHFGLGLLAALLLISGPAQAQSVIVQLLNGRNGKPIPNARVYIGFDDLKGRRPLSRVTDSQGQIRFEANGAKTFQVHPVGEVTCGEQPAGAPYHDFAIEEILKNGWVTNNSCGHLNREPLRGKLLYFVRPATWWELFKN